MPDTTETPEIAERWVYGGIRVNGKDQRRHAWIDESGAQHLYDDTGSFVPGGIYDVLVERDGDRILRSKPVYTGERCPPGKAETYARADHTARTRLAAKIIERRDAKTNALADAVEPIERIAARCRNTDERHALAAYVLRAIYAARN